MATHNLEGFAGTKYFHILDSEGARLLTYILKLGTNAPTAPPGIKFDNYLNNLPPGVNINYVSLSRKEKRKAIDGGQMNQINKYPMWDKFDVSLLYQAIRLGNKDVAPLDSDKWNNASEMEGLIKSIKKFRNDCVHEKCAVTDQNFDVKFNNLRDVFVKTLDAAQQRYNVPVMDASVVKNQILQDMDARKQTLNSMQAANFIMSRTRTFVTESQNHLKNEYRRNISFNPLSFLKHSPQGDIHVQTVYCEAYLENDRGMNTTRRTISCLDLLSLTCSAGQSSQPTTSSQSTQTTRPQLIMINGHAGSGKTTLVLYILSEWLKDAHDCKIAHLNDFDILYRILCRDTNNKPSLQEFLASTVPGIFSQYPQCLKPLMKRCKKVIFLIDGLDELSSGSPSEKLVNDILAVGTEMPNVNIICTSRPETVDYFMAKIPARYKKWELKMKGISTEHRSNFVLKHYSVFPSNSQTNPDTVERYMEKYGWRDYFGLPLNLLFVATLFYTDPNCLKNCTNQTSLYIKIHEWCTDKLLERLANKSIAHVSTEHHKISVRKVLHILYCVALHGFLEDNLRLTDKDVQRLTKCCTKRNLPVDEILGAFLCLREKVVKCVSHRWYAAPHKSLQEFFAAKFIVKKLIQLTHHKKRKSHHTDDSAQTPFTESIMQILENPSAEQLSKLRNLLLHVLGLLGQHGDQSLSGAVQDVVELVARSGVRDCGGWLSVLNDAEINDAALQRISQHIGDDEREVIGITDSNIDSVASLLPLIPRKRVYIDIEKAVDVNKVIKACEKHSCRVLQLHHHYKHPEQHSTSDSVLAARTWNELQEFTGHLTCEGIMSLQCCPSLSSLSLSFSGGSDSKDIPSALMSVLQSLHDLKYLRIHVPAMTLPTPWTATTSLPHGRDGDEGLYVMLVLSGVNDALMAAACKAAQTLQPKYGYVMITFPGSNMCAESLRCLLNGLASSGIRVGGGVLGRGGVVVPDSSSITQLQEIELNDLAKKLMLGGLKRTFDEAALWY